MKNLRTARVDTLQAVLPSQQDEITVCAYDAMSQQLVLATSAGSLICFSISAPGQVLWTLPLDLSSSDDTSIDSIIGLQLMMDNEILVVGTQNGELFSVSLSTQTVEAVGKLDGGISQMSASPDGELLAVISELGMLLLMSQDWEVLYELCLDQRVKGQGSSAHAADQSGSQASDPLQIRWRTDGKYFATLGGIGLPDDLKEVRIWERDTGTLHARSKAFPSIGTVLDWIPSGTRIASACTEHPAGMSTRICFFERNGLERGFFDIDGPMNVTVGRIQWNCNSELLAVLLRYKDWDAIQVWNFSNYHWYLKQEWRYEKAHHIDFLWDPEKPLCLITWTVKGSVQLINLCWDSAVVNESVALVIDGSQLLVTPLDLAVIPPPLSLFKLKFNAPVQTAALQLSERKGYLAVSLCDGTIRVLELPSVEEWSAFEDSEVCIPIAQNEMERFHTFRLLSWLDPGTLVGVSNTQNIFSPWVISTWSVDSSPEVLVEMDVLEDKEDSHNKTGNLSWTWACKYRGQSQTDKKVLAIVKSPMDHSLLVHLEDGSFSSYVLNIGLLGDKYRPSKLDSPSLWIRALSHSNEAVIVALDAQGNLQVGPQRVCIDCTSFTVHNKCIDGKKVTHILYTTKQDVLHVDNVTDILRSEKHGDNIKDISGLSSSSTGAQFEGAHLAKKGKKDMLKTRTMWERGARLITALEGRGACVILQTTRGNLETIFPRNLVLGSIAAALCERNFSDAISLARRHHMNLNLIVDFRGWEAFLQFAVEFIRQVKNLNHVTELICAVSAGNVTDSIYYDLLLPYMKKIVHSNGETAIMDSQSQSSEIQGLALGMKVRSVLHAIRKAVVDEVDESPKKELCILTTMARSDPPELEEALCRIKKLREDEMEHLIGEEDIGHTPGRLTADEALKHLLWLSDSESVFNAALGLYDLHLAAMVASNSQRDPKEFLPFLMELEEMPTPLMKYTIDYKLGRFESALRNLASAGTPYFEKCLDLIKDNPFLFPLGKQLFKEGPERVAVLEVWGEHLLSEEKYEDAAASFCSCSCLNKALGAYRAGGHWQSVLLVAGMVGLSHEAIVKLAYDLREELQALGRPGDAAKIALEYCKDIEDSIQLFVEAREWTEAVRIAYLHEKMQLVKEQIIPAALECTASYISGFEEGIEKIGKYLARYLAVKQRRLLLEMKLKMDASEDLDDDAVSDVSSHVSGMSAYTTGARSSKASVQASIIGSEASKQSRRKSRGGKIRAGSPGEEAALVEHLKGMELTAGTTEDIRKLLQVLVLLGYDTMAEKLQRLTLQYQSVQQKSLSEATGSAGKDSISGLGWCLEVLNIPGIP